MTQPWRKLLRSIAGNLALLVSSSVLCLLVAEGLVRALDLFPEPRAAAEPVAGPQAAAVSEEPAVERVLHPFRGWAWRPEAASAQDSSDRPPTNLFGFRSFDWDYRELEAADLVVGIFGGSVALGITNQGGDALLRALEELLPEQAGRIRLVALAGGGYKQPQQLFLLAEMQMLGVPLDVVVNVDGFNEVGLGSRDAHRQYHPLFPYRNYWETLVQFAGGSLSEAQIVLAAEVLEHRDRARSLRRSLARHPGWGRWQLVRAVVGARIADAERQAAVSEERLGELEPDDRFEVTARLPDPCLGKLYACWPLITSIWQRSSEMMNALARDAGAVYLHVLQPNQYVEGSKTLTAEELSRAFDLDRRWSRGARLGYPHLRRAGAELRARGVDFHDLTMIFSDHQETIYNDTCCHFNRHGYEVVAAEIAREIAAALAGRPPAPRSTGRDAGRSARARSHGG